MASCRPVLAVPIVMHLSEWTGTLNQGSTRCSCPNTPPWLLQSNFGMTLHGPAALASLPCDAFRYAFLGDLDNFK